MALNNGTLLKYINYEDVNIKEHDKLNSVSINKQVNRLIENDKALLPSNIIPTVWERKWFNNPGVSGYKKDDLFWYNSETYQDFINKNHVIIYNYCKNNWELHNIIKPYDGSYESFTIYTKLINGLYQLPNGKYIPKLFDLGDATKPLQIKRSLHDNNKDTLDVLSSYEDIIDDNEIKEMTSLIEEEVKSIFDDHVKNYHANRDILSNEELQELELKYVHNIHEIDSKNKIIADSGNNIRKVEGFDYIQKFVKYKDEEKGTNSWFRYWNSGLLEHGGIIKTDKNTKNSYITVPFDWQYKINDTSFASPKYESYSINNNTYGFYSNLPDENGNIDWIGKNTLDKNRYYSVSVTPLNDSYKIDKFIDSKTEISIDYLDKQYNLNILEEVSSTVEIINTDEQLESAVIITDIKSGISPDEFNNYNNIDIVNLSANGFQIKINSLSSDYYSYYVKGYTKFNEIKYFDYNYIKPYHVSINALDPSLINYNIPLRTEITGTVIIGNTDYNGNTICELENKYNKGAFEDCSNITIFKFNNSFIKTIPISSFSGCTSLTYIKLPDNLNVIEKYAFNNCPSLNTLDIHSNVKLIETGAFSGCSGLKNININNTTVEIQENAFPSTATEVNLTSFNVPSGLTPSNIADLKITPNTKVIKNSSFSNLINIKTIDIPWSVETIESLAFYNCSGVENICVPPTVKYIGNGAFNEVSAKNLTSDYIPSGLTRSTIENVCTFDFTERIQDWAFSGASKVKELNLPSKLKEIGESAFENCNSLLRTFVNGTPSENKNDLYIPKSVDVIKTKAFSGCNSLRSINIENGNINIVDNAFSGVNNVTDLTASYVNKIGIGLNNLSSVHIPENTFNIRENAFNNCTNISSLNVPASVYSIENNAFKDCKKLNSIYFENSKNLGPLSAVGIFNNCPLNDGIESTIWNNGSITFYYEGPNKNILLKCKRANFGVWDDLTLDPNITHIYHNAFDNNNVSNLLRYVEFPPNLKSIGNYAFQGKDWLCVSNDDIISIPDSVTWIGSYAFNGCLRLQRVKMSKNIEYIGEGAFKQSHLGNLPLIIPRTIKYIGKDAFNPDGWKWSTPKLVFEGQTIAQVKNMKNYPWGLTSYSCSITCIDGVITVF